MRPPGEGGALTASPGPMQRRSGLCPRRAERRRRGASIDGAARGNMDGCGPRPSTPSSKRRRGTRRAARSAIGQAQRDGLRCPGPITRRKCARWRAASSHSASVRETGWRSAGRIASSGCSRISALSPPVRSRRPTIQRSPAIRPPTCSSIRRRESPSCTTPLSWRRSARRAAGFRACGTWC